MTEKKLSNQQILEKAIQKAIDGGFDITELGISTHMLYKKDYAAHTVSVFGDNPYTIIFNHDFAKALVGTDMQNGQPRWKNFLQFIVVQDNPIEALEMFL